MVSLLFVLVRRDGEHFPARGRRDRELDPAPGRGHRPRCAVSAHCSSCPSGSCRRSTRRSRPDHAGGGAGANGWDSADGGDRAGGVLLILPPVPPRSSRWRCWQWPRCWRWWRATWPAVASAAVRSSSVALCAAIGVTLSAPLTGAGRLAPAHPGRVGGAVRRRRFDRRLSDRGFGHAGGRGRVLCRLRYTLLVFAFLLDLACSGSGPTAGQAGAALWLGPGSTRHPGSSSREGGPVPGAA